MTDQELIALLDERRPHEWTPDEIARLRERLPHSPELRAALHSELALEAGLQEQLGKYDVPIDAILAKAAGKQAGWRLGLLLGWTAAAVVLTAGLLYWNGAFDSPVPIAQVEATAETTPEASPEPSAAGTLAATAEATPAAPQATGEGSPSGMPTPEATPRGTPIPVPIAAPEPEVRLVLREADLFEDFVRLRVPPTEDELKKLVVPVAGALRFYQGPDRSGTGIEGQGQLALPNGKWPAGATLRLAMFELQNFRIHAWSGLAGATFTFQMHDQQGWAGYITSREQPGETR
ncbi:MAG TPA: hypothetical protein VGE52_13335, partial [Pirellulales bacterium]